ncbi:alpha-L-rhamnosidase C-terminal domain-containing protein [Actinophytocola sp.]|uniref:alpha-L-rhamnosidase C-terminal domain-containing protein n=1 Tax=Actinophytocola sp. TaxID=1872138 RepID=UPI003D6A08DC
MLRRTYGWQLDRDPGTLWEGYGLGGRTDGFFGTYLTSMTHGHMAGAAAVLTNHVLGVAPADFGFRAVDIVPRPGDVTWAQGRVPTPHGAIDVGWRKDGDTFRMTVAVPKGTSARVGVPTSGAPVRITVDGELAWDGAAGPGLHARAGGEHVYLDDLPPGDHEVLAVPR